MKLLPLGSDEAEPERLTRDSPVGFYMRVEGIDLGTYEQAEDGSFYKITNGVRAHKVFNWNNTYSATTGYKYRFLDSFLGRRP